MHKAISLPLLLLLLLIGAPGLAIGQKAYNDSMATVVDRIASKLKEAGHTRVAVMEVRGASGDIPEETAARVTGSLLLCLAGIPGITIVEREALDLVLDEQRRSASGIFDDEQAIELGRLLSADAIITGRIHPSGKRMHLILRVLDSTTGTLVTVAETELPRDKSSGRKVVDTGTQTVPRAKRERVPSERANILEGRVGPVGGGLHPGWTAGGMLELGVRVREGHNDGKVLPGRWGMGLQLGFWPMAVRSDEVPFRVGHLNQVISTTGSSGEWPVSFGGTPIQQGAFFLLNKTPVTLGFKEVGGAGAPGVEKFSYDTYGLRDIRMDMTSANVPIRWYLSDGYAYDNVVKLYVEMGIGLDVALVQASYETITTTVRLDRNDYTYEVEEDRKTGTAPPWSEMGSSIWLTHWSLGGGLELGRFNLYALGRWFISRDFQLGSEKYDRVRGNAIAYPIWAGAHEDNRLLNDLMLGAVPYGASGLEKKAGSLGGDSERTISGNGVNRFWKSGYFLFGLSFRLY